MLNQNAVFDTQDVGRNPIHGEAHATEAPMHDYKLGVGNDHSGFVLQGRWNALDEVE